MPPAIIVARTASSGVSACIRRATARARGSRRSMGGLRQRGGASKAPPIMRPIASIVRPCVGIGARQPPAGQHRRRSEIAISSSRSWLMTTTAAPPAASVDQRLRGCAAAARASTPQVGWLTTSTAGDCSTSRPITNFCRLPPESARALASVPGVRTSKVGDRPGAAKALDRAELRGTRARPAPARRRRREERVLGQASCRGPRRGPAAPRARCRRPSCAGRSGRGGRSRGRRARIAPRGTRRSPEKREQQLVLAVAGDAGDAEDLAARAARGRCRVRLVPKGSSEGSVRPVSARTVGADGVGASGGARPGARRSSSRPGCAPSRRRGVQVATTRPPRRIVAPVAERADLLELVADVEDGDALGARACAGSRRAAPPPAGSGPRSARP